MRNETEFKAEILSRFEAKKKEIKKRRRTLAAALPSLALVLIVSAVFLSDGFGTTPNTDGFDGAAVGNEEYAENDGAEKIEIYDGIAEDAGLGVTDGNSAVRDESSGSISLSRTYSEKEKVDGFKALLGEFKEIETEGENKSSATGAVITLISGDTAEKYIFNRNGIYTEDMQKYFPLDEKKFQEISRFLTQNMSDEEE